jgi:dienelactone hydrolase
MKQIINNSDTVIIVVHEIYGINVHISGVCDRLAEVKYDVLCPNLLGSRQEPFHYNEEALAYRHFMKEVGFAAAQEQIEVLARGVRGRYRYCFIVGYSIGATIAWLCSGKADLFSGVVGVYGSRIRDYTAIEPKCPVLLCFPRAEESFDVSELLQALSGKSNLNLLKAAALHGFADPWSKKYCAAASEALWQKTLGFIDGQRTRSRSE